MIKLFFLYSLVFLPFFNNTNIEYSSKKEDVKKECQVCSSKVDAIEFNDIPNFEQAEWYESTDIWYGRHYTSIIVFSNGLRGKIFKGGSSGKYFIGGKSGGKFYYYKSKSYYKSNVFV